MFVKLEKYRNAGVREYWIVDLQKEKVIVYLFGEEPDIGLYGFDSRIPVGIYGGDCQIDFTEVVRNLKMAERLGRSTKRNDPFDTAGRSIVTAFEKTNQDCALQ